MNAIDTNIWIYRYDVRDPANQHTAEQLILTVRPFSAVMAGWLRVYRGQSQTGIDWVLSR
jgi:hypothetical protein